MDTLTVAVTAFHASGSDPIGRVPRMGSARAHDVDQRSATSPQVENDAGQRLVIVTLFAYRAHTRAGWRLAPISAIVVVPTTLPAISTHP
jgi:hypothetical protein